MPECSRSWWLRREHVSDGLHRAVLQSHLRPSRVSEEVSACDRHAEGRTESHRNSALSRQRGLRSMAKKPLIPVTPSSGNVFADIGVPEAEEELAKAQLASRIREIVRGSRLTQVAAAAVMGIDQPKVSALLSGRLTNFSSERLMRLLTRLGQDVE